MSQLLSTLLRAELAIETLIVEKPSIALTDSERHDSRIEAADRVLSDPLLLEDGQLGCMVRRRFASEK